MRNTQDAPQAHSPSRLPLSFLALAGSLAAHALGAVILNHGAHSGPAKPQNTSSSLQLSLDSSSRSAPRVPTTVSTGTRRMRPGSPTAATTRESPPSSSGSRTQASPTSSTADPRMVFLQRLHEHIRLELSQQTPPTGASLASGPRLARVEFSVNRAGRIEGVRLEESTGERTLDRWLRSSLAQARPIAELPATLFAENAPEFRASLPVEITAPHRSSPKGERR